ncbi:NlpC/P60 family protein [Streptomyces sp. NBC_01171]|uniref:C40 family peptidase n=1 Tax=Streptomyces sp. NBC_01171 TaxID=2903757 RepID=UPI003863AA01|nr:NlpC/P60 family protein [Streptomyces sp. NBC_01171]
MAAHRKLRARSLSGNTARTAATLALAGAATATAFDGTGHAEPQLTTAQVKAQVDRLYREAETATEKYNGAHEKASAAQHRLNTLRDETARRQDRLNTARGALGAFAAAQYRDGAIAPSWQLALSSSPDRYLDDAAFADRAGHRQAQQVTRVRAQLREIERLRGAARIEAKSVRSRQAELKRQKDAVTTKLERARQLLARLTPPEREKTTTGAPAVPVRAGTGGRSAPAPATSGKASTGRTTAPTARVPAPTSRASAAVAYAYRKLGSPYVWGATGPDAFDCSGLIQAAYRSAGISLPRTTYAQINAGRRVSRSQLQPGDLVFFYSGVSHVGIYVGNGRMIHAPNPSAPVRVAPIDQMPFAGATRVA